MFHVIDADRRFALALLLLLLFLLLYASRRYGGERSGIGHRMVPSVHYVKRRAVSSLGPQ
jgi:hypothetical protein